MDYVLALLAPGQGAQTPGMLIPWLDDADIAAALRWSAAVTGIDLVALGTTGTAEEIRDTAVAQPLLVALALAVADRLLHDSDRPIVAGHSVGEFAAAALAGALTAETALTLVRERGRLMAAASAQPPTGMSAVLGGDADEVAVALDRHGLTAANVNTAGQVVAAGPLDALEAFAADPPARARVRALQVAGAFHTDFMTSARDGLAVLAENAPRTDPHRTLLGNADGAVVRTGDDVVRRLVEQVARPVRWDLCMTTLADLGVTATVELAPGGTLTGLVRRAMPGVETFAITTPDDLATARAMLDRHAVATSEPAPSWRVAVAPVAGTFRRAETEPGTTLAPGAPLGVVVSNRSESSVDAVHGGVLVEWLAYDGDPVSPGQALARLHPVNEDAFA
ncbi:MAG: [acyl-carrier-protein] S-malonyltransferase [Frankiaceae bacterium]|nr:[acyl-carrier-protein] S-malonyltransferase [Frankiaceae bacterium]